MTTVGMIGAGEMGSGLGWSLRAGGHRVVTTVAGRSARTAALAKKSTMAILADLDAVVSAATILLVVTPPGAASSAAAQIVDACRRTGATPLVADLNAISPATMDEVAATYGAAGLDAVDGAISGPPPTARPGARIYLSGTRAGEVAGLRWTHVEPIVVDDQIGSASAVKMCTASVYKGLVGLFAQSMRTAAHFGVLAAVLDDLAASGHHPPPAVTVAVTKARRYVPEMHEIAATQALAGLPASLFAAFAEVYQQLAGTELARQHPETVDRNMSAAELAARLATAPRPGPGSASSHQPQVRTPIG